MPCPGEYLRLCSILHKRHAETKKYGPSERTDQNSRKKLSNGDIANLSDAEFKALVIRMLTELVENGCKTEGKVMAMKSEIKENVQGTNSDVKLGLKSSVWTRRKK